jgi:hypothetical protein
MESQTSRKIIVASSMAAVLGIGVVAFALSSHHHIPAAQIPQSAPPVVPSTPDASAAVAPSADAAAGVAPTPIVPAAVVPVPDAPAVAH